MKHDASQSPNAAYGSEKWCAERLGLSYDAYRTRLAVIEADGFPKKDALIGLRIKADVDAWIDGRRRLNDRVTVGTNSDAITIGINHAKL